MRQTLIKWTLVAGAGLVVGPLAGRLCSMLRAPDGGPDATALLCTSPALGLAATLGAIALAGVYAVIASRLLNFKWGMMCGGIITGWSAWQSGRADAILRRAQSSAPLWTLAVEAAIYAVLGLTIVQAAVSASDKKLAGLGQDDGARQDGLKAAAIAALLGGVVAWGVARSEMVGQTFAAVVAAAVVGTLVGRVVGHRASVPASALGCLLVGVAGPIIGASMHGPRVIDALFTGQLFPLARIMPLDWLSGTLVGVAIGVSWAGSMVEKHAPAGAPSEAV